MNQVYELAIDFIGGRSAIYRTLNYNFGERGLEIYGDREISRYDLKTFIPLRNILSVSINEVDL